MRRLDCAVVEMTHTLCESTGKKPFDSVRGCFGRDKNSIPTQDFEKITTYGFVSATETASRVIFILVSYPILF